MKQLILCRHSRPEAADGPSPDRDRQLTADGAADARSIGEQLVSRGVIPDVILSSDSARTRQTTEAICRAFSTRPEIFYLADLYSAAGGTILDVAATHADGAGTILMVGHNPGMEEAAWQIARRPIHLHTSTVVIFGRDGSSGGSARAPLDGLLLREVFGPA